MAAWVIKRGTREVPIPDEATLRKWAAEGRFNASDLIFHPDLQRWLYAQDVLEIRAAFQKAEVVTSLPRESDDSTLSSSQSAQARSSEFIVQQGGQNFRAPDVATVHRWAQEGRVSHDSYVFHPVLNRWYARELAELEDCFNRKPTELTKVATNYRRLVLCVAVQVLISLALFVFSSLSLILVPALFATIVALMVYAYRTSVALGSSSAPLWAAAMLFPFTSACDGVTAVAVRFCRMHR
jgi:hypothetical protein